MAAHARLKNEFTEDEKCHNLMSWLIFGFLRYFRFVMEENSPYARPIKHMNAVRRGLHSEDVDLEEDNVSPSHTASDRVQDQNLSVKQLFMRFSGE